MNLRKLYSVLFDSADKEVFIISLNLIQTLYDNVHEIQIYQSQLEYVDRGTGLFRKRCLMQNNLFYKH